jgi:hypothetical protein
MSSHFTSFLSRTALGLSPLAPRDRWTGLDGLPQMERERILSVMDALIRDAKARQTYGGHQANG